METKLGRNKEWDRLPEESKQKFIQNLPISFPFMIAIFLLLFFGTPLILKLLFPNLSTNYYEWIRISLSAIYVLFIVGYASWNYKKKTGKNLNEDM